MTPYRHPAHSRAQSLSRALRPASVSRSALASGAVATGTSILALALVGRRAGMSAARPLNATSHWLHGDVAAAVDRLDVDHTGVGLATHAAATVFWALFFEAWRARRPAFGLVVNVQRAAAVATLAAVVDYTITPKRFTPGWELVLSKGAMTVVYAAMAAGFAASALARDPQP